jgi:hypothetical protein
MANLNDVLGIILRDIVQARVMSDVFSRDASLDYANDAILVGFPVPRAEIKQASVQLKFAVNTVKKTTVDVRTIAAANVQPYSEQLAKQVFETVILQAPNREELLNIIERNQIKLNERLVQQVEQVLNQHLDSVNMTAERAIAALVKLLQEPIEALLRENAEFWNQLRRRTRVTDIQASLNNKLAEGVSGFVNETHAAIADANQKVKSLIDVAVTRDELIDVPDATLSEISLVAEIRNYEWTETVESDGTVVRRLQAE